MAKGTPLVNLLPIDPGERMATAVKADFAPGKHLVLVTAKGKVKRTPIEKFAYLRSRGLIAISVRSGDEAVVARMASDSDELILITEQGKSIRFPVSGFRALSRGSQGVRGIRLNPGDRVVAMEVIYPGAYVLTVTSNGFGKFSLVAAYPVHRRGGKGVLAHRVGEKIGKVVAATLTTRSGELMLISERGVIIRVPKESIPVHGRSTKGVSLMKMDRGNEVVSIACLEGNTPGGASK
jgi:DNA gyrase subunit A